MARRMACPGSGVAHQVINALACGSVTALPFAAASFDVVVSFETIEHLDAADQPRMLAEFARVTRPGGRVLVLEFSKVWKPLAKPYDAYSFNVLPWLGRHVAKDEDAYQYLAESIRMHPDQEALRGLMEDAGFDDVRYHNLSGGIVALHIGFRY